MNIKSRFRVGISTMLMITGLVVAIAQPTSATPGAPRWCSAAQLTVRIAHGGVGLGHVAERILITNVSAHPCAVAGYPNVQLSGGAGVASIEAKKTQHGYLGGLGQTSHILALPVTELRARNGRASSMVEGSDVPRGSATKCVIYTKVVINLPHVNSKYRITAGFPGCVRPQVHPIVKGDHGDAAH